jgi:hypothetical protein
MTEEASPVGAEHCRHHWLIAPARGVLSPGVCKFCGAVREFSNDPDVGFTVAQGTMPGRVFLDRPGEQARI